MKFTWTAQDVIPGRYICKPPENKPHTAEDFEKLAMTTWKLGYSGGCGVMSTIAMTDGAICLPNSNKESLAIRLNDEGYIPMPHKWLIGVMEAMRDWYEGV